MNRPAEFLLKLAALCAEYNAGFAYTVDDDGIHISVDGTDVFIGYLDTDAAETISEYLRSGKIDTFIIFPDSPYNVQIPPKT